jgi:hypothetical protein
MTSAKTATLTESVYRFHGILANTMVMPQELLSPAYIKPAPIRPANQ